MASDPGREARRERETRRVLSALPTREFRASMKYRAPDGTRPFVVVLVDDLLRDVTARMGDDVHAANVVLVDSHGARVMVLKRNPAEPDLHADRRVDVGQLNDDMTMGLLAELGAAHGGHLNFEVGEMGRADKVEVPVVSGLLQLA